MSMQSEAQTEPFGGSVTKALLLASKVFAIAGGVSFCAMVVLSVISIVGRKLWSAPIYGDVEMLEMGTGIAAAMFFPYCTLMGEHLRVEFFTAKAPLRVRAVLDGCANFLLAAAMAVFAWRSYMQVLDVMNTGEVSDMRNIPVWIPVACLVPSLALTALCALNRALSHFSAGWSKA